jgi:hypothetical protein
MEKKAYKEHRGKKAEKRGLCEVYIYSPHLSESL